jgi:hypothetical protein
MGKVAFMKFRINKFFDSNRDANGFCLYGEDVDTMEEQKFYPKRKFNARLYQACSRAGEGGIIEFETYRKGDFVNISDKTVKISGGLSPAESDGMQSPGPAIAAGPVQQPKTAKGDFRSRMEIIRTSAMEMAVATLGIAELPAKTKKGGILMVDAATEIADLFVEYIVGNKDVPESSTADLEKTAEDGQPEPPIPEEDDIPF